MINSKIFNRKSFSVLTIVLLLLIGLGIYSLVKSKKYTETSVPVIENEFDIVYGNDSALVKVFMYSSYNCSFCRKFLKEVFPHIQDSFINTGIIKFNIKLIDVVGDSQMLNAIKTAVCINMYGNFDKLNELLLFEPSSVYTEEFYSVTNELVNKNDFFAECMLGGRADRYLVNNLVNFKSNNLKGTPTFIINNRIYNGYKSYSFFEEVVKKQLSNINN